jgi:hypothetical protein
MNWKGFGRKQSSPNGKITFAFGWTKKENNSVALVRYRTMPTERPPLVGEVSANFCG